MSVTVSVIIPVFNGAKFILDCLSSVTAQILSDQTILEIILIDDCSSDETVNIIKNYINDYSGNHNIVLIENTSNSGPAISRNNGIKIANGKYLAFLDSDDQMMPNRITAQLESLSKSKNDICFSGVSEIDENDNFIRSVVRPHPTEIDDLLLKTVLDDLHLVTSTVLLKKQITDKIGAFNEDLLHFEDYDFFLKIFRKSGSYYIPEKLTLKRVFTGSMSFTVSEEEFVESREKFFEIAKKGFVDEIELSRKYWGRQYFGLARILQINGHFKNARIYYLKSLKLGFKFSYLGLLLTYLPQKIQILMSKFKWRRNR